MGMSDDRESHIMEHKIMIQKFKEEQKVAKEKAYSILETAENFDEVADILVPYYGTGELIEALALFQEKNIYYNSPLAKAMREIEEEF